MFHFIDLLKTNQPLETSSKHPIIQHQINIIYYEPHINLYFVTFHFSVSLTSNQPTWSISEASHYSVSSQDHILRASYQFIFCNVSLLCLTHKQSTYLKQQSTHSKHPRSIPLFSIKSRSHIKSLISIYIFQCFTSVFYSQLINPLKASSKHPIIQYQEKITY
jgi:hypothetical protein